MQRGNMCQTAHVNIGFWQPLTALADHVIAQGFAAASLREFFVVVETVEALEAALGVAL